MRPQHTRASRRFSALQRAEIAETYSTVGDVIELLGFSALQRAEIAETVHLQFVEQPLQRVSVLFNEPKLLKRAAAAGSLREWYVSVLFNEPKLLKHQSDAGFNLASYVSVLFNEPKLLKSPD